MRAEKGEILIQVSRWLVQMNEIHSIYENKIKGDVPFVDDRQSHTKNILYPETRYYA